MIRDPLRVGDKVASLRVGLGLKQADVVRVWGRSQPRLSQIETGVKNMSRQSYRELLEAMLVAALQAGATPKELRPLRQALKEAP
jgi:transcriptional regulator with XRE-family HTH domain